MELYNASQIVIENGIRKVYVEAPFYMSIWFYIGVSAILAGLIFVAWAWFTHYAKNRTNFRIHFPDKNVRTFSIKKFNGEYVELKYGDKDRDGNMIKHRHHVVPECIETGFFGRYLDYLAGEIEPVNFQRIKDMRNIPGLSKAVESYLNSETLSWLLLIGKLKEFFTIMLYVILGSVILGIIILGLMQLYVSAPTTCSLIDNNQTLAVIRHAIGK